MFPAFFERHQVINLVHHYKWCQKSFQPLKHTNAPTHTIHGTGIFAYIWLILIMVNVAKYTRHMDPMGCTLKHSKT